MNPAEEYVQCNLCGSDSFIPKFVGKDRLHKVPGDWSVVKCSVCGLEYINPRPTKQSLALYYPQIYWDGASSRRLIRAIWTLHTILSRPIHYEISIPKPPNGRLLDIGCGAGGYLASMKRSGWEAYGAELSSRV